MREAVAGERTGRSTSSPRRRSERGVAGRIGNTPLLRLRSLEPRPGVEVYAKAEWTNPGGSVKDRAALSMIRDGERMGRLRPGMIVLDASSGNTGIAYALLGRELGYPVEIVLPANASRPRLRILDRLGAELVLTDPQEGMDGAIAEARMRRRHSVGRYFYPDQYNNPANWRAHYHGTAGEILDQTGGRITHFVAGLGTTGTFTGVARRLREEQPHVRLVAMQPDSPLHGLEGLKHLATVRVPGIHDPGLAHENRTASTESARTMRVRLFHDENLDVGPSAAAAALVAAEVAEKLERGVVVTVFPDGGEKYAEDPLWEVG